MVQTRLDELHKHSKDVHTKVHQMNHEVSHKEQLLRDLTQKIGELQKLEGIWGYEFLKDITTDSIKKSETIKQQNFQLSQQVENLEFDQRAKDSLISALQKEVIMMTFLNGRLSDQLAEADPESGVSKYSHEFFKRNKKLKDKDAELYKKVKDQVSSRVKYEHECLLLREQLDSTLGENTVLRDQLQAKNKELEQTKREAIKQRPRSESVHQVASIEQPESTSSFDEAHEELTRKHELDAHVANLEKQNLIQECSELRQQLRDTVVMNDQLNLSCLDLRLERDSLALTVAKLEKDLESILKIHSDALQELAKAQLEVSKVKIEKEVIQSDLNSRLTSEAFFNEKTAYFHQSLKELKVYLINSHSQEEKRSAAEIELLGSLEKWTLHQYKLIEELAHERSRYAEANGVKIKKEFESKLQEEKIQIMDFKIQALGAYSGVLEQKCKNLEVSIGEFFSRVKTLEAERESMETNTALEAVKEFLDTKRRELEAAALHLDEVFDQNEQTRRSEAEAAELLATSTQQTIQNLQAQFASAKDSLEARVLEVQEQARQSLEVVKRQGQASLQARADEIAQLKQKLEKADLEGSLEMKKDLESLLNANELLQKELTILETRLALEDLNHKAIQEIEKIELSLQSQKHATE